VWPTGGVAWGGGAHLASWLGARGARPLPPARLCFCREAEREQGGRRRGGQPVQASSGRSGGTSGRARTRRTRSGEERPPGRLGTEGRGGAMGRQRRHGRRWSSAMRATPVRLRGGGGSGGRGDSSGGGMREGGGRLRVNLGGRPRRTRRPWGKQRASPARASG
jgi:hypothetical protein